MTSQKTRNTKLLALQQREEEKWKTSRLEGTITQKFINSYGTVADKSAPNKLISTLVHQHLQEDGNPNSKDLEMRIAKEVAALKARISLRKTQSSSRPEMSNAMMNTRSMKPLNLIPNQKLSNHDSKESSINQTSGSNTNRKSSNHLNHNDQKPTDHFYAAQSKLATDWSLLSALSIIESEDDVIAKKQALIEKRLKMKKELEETAKAKEIQKQLKIKEEKIELQKSLENDAKIEIELKRKQILKQELLRKENKAFEEIALKRSLERKSEAEEKARLERIEMKRILKEQEIEKIKKKEKILCEKNRLEKELKESFENKRKLEMLKLEEHKLEMKQAKEHQIKLDLLLKQRAEERQLKLDHAFDCALISESDEWQSCMNNIPIRKRKDTPTILKRVEKECKQLEIEADLKNKNKLKFYELEQSKIYSENSKLVDAKMKAKVEEYQDVIYHHNLLNQSEHEAAQVEAIEIEKKKNEILKHKKSLAEQVEMNRKIKKNYNMTDAERLINRSNIIKLEEIARKDPYRVSKVLQHFPQKGSHQASLKK